MEAKFVSIRLKQEQKAAFNISVLSTVRNITLLVSKQSNIAPQRNNFEFSIIIPFHKYINLLYKGIQLI